MISVENKGKACPKGVPHLVVGKTTIDVVDPLVPKHECQSVLALPSVDHHGDGHDDAVRPTVTMPVCQFVEHGVSITITSDGLHRRHLSLCREPNECEMCGKAGTHWQCPTCDIIICVSCWNTNTRCVCYMPTMIDGPSVSHDHHSGEPAIPSVPENNDHKKEVMVEIPIREKRQRQERILRLLHPTKRTIAELMGAMIIVPRLIAYNADAIGGAH